MRAVADLKIMMMVINYDNDSDNDGGPCELGEGGGGDEEGRGAHHDPELRVVDLAVPVLVHRPDHLVYLLVGHLNPPPCTMLGSTDGASLTFPGRWVSTNFNSSAVMQPDILNM